MNKLVVAIALMMVYNISMACSTTTIMIGDKAVVCTICPTVTVCN